MVPCVSSLTSRCWTIDNPVESSAPIQIHVLTYSPTERTEDVIAPPTVIALHYWGGSASTFHHVPGLVQSTQKSQTPFRGMSTFVSISHRGWGLSSAAVPDSPSAYSIAALASDVIRLLPQFRSQGLIPLSGYAFCAHSMGGKVAMATSQLVESLLPRDFPKLRGILFLAPAPPSPLVLPEEMKEQRLHAYDNRDLIEWAIRNVLAGSNGELLHGGQDFEMIVRDSLKGSEGAKKAWTLVAMAEEIDIKQVDGNSSNLKLRVLVSEGDRVETVDSVNQETVKLLQTKGYSIRLRILKEYGKEGNNEASVGHLLPLEAPELVAEELVAILHDICIEGDE